MMRKNLRYLLLFFLASFLAVFLRLFYLQVIRHDFYMTKSLEQRQRIISLSADRGDIYDSTGSVLATSVDTYSVFAYPRKMTAKAEAITALSKILGIKRAAVADKILNSKGFVWIQRKIPKETWAKIKEKKLQGIDAFVEKKRVYAKGRLASQVLGFVGIDDIGLSGIELGFDRYLKGVEGVLVTELDPSGRELLAAHPREIRPPAEGQTVTLTLDEVVQYFAERALSPAVRSHGARSGTVVVMDVKSGEILAMASKPDFNPNEYSTFPPSTWNAKAVLDVYEPGSTFKLITAAAALEDGVMTTADRLFCPDHIVVGGKVIRNSHKLRENEKHCRLSEILQFSINTGVVQVAMKIGDKKFFEYIKAFGFGARTRVGVPGETPGILRNVSEWSKPDIATISFGQGIAVTPLQMLSAVATIANGGVRMRPILVKKIESVDGSFVKIFPPQEMGRVISEKTASEMRDLMVDVVEKGTGKPAGIKYFKVGGKTGTAQKTRPGGPGYWPGHFVSSFVGIAPATKPRIAVIVVIDEPKGEPWGERVAAPVFASVAEDTLRYLNVAPDDLKKTVMKD